MAENAKRLNPGDHELLANISSREELSYRDLEKVLDDQDDLAASRDEDPAEDSTDISADMGRLHRSRPIESRARSASAPLRSSLPRSVEPGA